MTERTLFTGPNHQTVEETAFEWARDHADDGIDRILYLTDSNTRHHRITDRWQASYDSLTLRTETLTSFVFDSYEALEGPSTPLAGATEQRALEWGLDHLITDRPWLSSQPHAPATLVTAFYNRFARFQNQGLNTPAKVRAEFADSELPPRIAETTVDAYEAFFERRADLESAWHVEYSHAAEAVAQSDIPALQPHVDVVILSGFIDPSVVDRAVLESLCKAFPTAAIQPSFGDDTSQGVDEAVAELSELYAKLDFESKQVQPTYGSAELQQTAKGLYRNPPPTIDAVPTNLEWRELATPEREVRFVAREIRDRLAESPSLDIGVVVPGFNSYEGYLADVLATYELPYTVETATGLPDTFVGSAVSSLVALADADPRAADLTALVTNPLVNLLDSSGEDAILRAERYVDSVRAEAVLQEVHAEVASELTELLDRLEPLQTSAFPAGVKPLSAELDRLDVPAGIEAAQSQINPSLEQAALQEVEAILDSFEAVQSEETTLTAAAALRRAIQGASIDGYTDSTAPITVLNMIDAHEFAFDHLYIVGLTTEHFPATVRYPAFFEDMVDKHPVLDVLDPQLRDRYLFATLLGNADAVTLTTPGSDPHATAVVRSPICDELNRLTGIEPTTGIDHRIGSTEDLQRAISPLDQRRAAVDAAGDRGDLTIEQTITTDRGIQCATERADPDLSPHDGLLAPETVAAIYPASEREPFSPSRIERYVNCGFQFYMEHVLGFEDDDTYERTPDPLETGSFIHDTFEAFFGALQSTPGDPVEMTAYSRTELESQLLDSALEVLADSDFAYDGLFYQRWLEQLFAGLATPASNPHFGGSRPHDTVEDGLFSRFVATELDRDAPPNPTWFELPFGAGLSDGSDHPPFEIEGSDGTSVSLRGYIDRVDVGPTDDGFTMELLDYKTGYAPSMTTVTGGTTFQLPIYLRAAEDVLEDSVDTVTTRSATYYQTKPPNKITKKRGLESKFDSQAELDRFLQEVLPDRLTAVTSAMKAGRFQTTLLSEREAGCDHCDFRRSCDVRHHQRRDRVATLDSDPDTYVPIRATDREFTDVFGGPSDD